MSSSISPQSSPQVSWNQAEHWQHFIQSSAVLMFMSPNCTPQREHSVVSGCTVHFFFVFLFTGLFAVAGQFTSLSPKDLFGVLVFLTDCPVPLRFGAVARVFWLLSASCKYCLYGLAVRTVGRPVVGVRRRRRETFTESDAFGRGLISAAEMKVDDVDDCMELLVEFPNSTGPFVCLQSLCTSGSSAEHAQTKHGMGG